MNVATFANASGSEDSNAAAINKGLANSSGTVSSNGSSANVTTDDHQVKSAALASAHVSDPGAVYAGTSASADGDGFAGTTIVKTEGEYPSTTTNQTFVNNPPVSGSAYAVGATSTSTNGITVGMSHAEATDGLTRASATAIGYSGLKDSGSLTDMQGGLAPEIHARFDYQVTEHWLMGAELDLSMPGGDGASDTATTSILLDGDVGQSIDLSKQLRTQTNAMASARLRLGYALGDYLVYGTGGLAYATFDATLIDTANLEGTPGAAQNSATKSDEAWGGVIGAGLSTFVSDNAAVSLEGLYYVFDEEIDFGRGRDKSTVSLDNAFSVMMKFSIRAN